MNVPSKLSSTPLLISLFAALFLSASLAAQSKVPLHPQPSRITAEAWRTARQDIRSADLESKIDYLLDRAEIEDIITTYAENCILARRLVERGVRFVQLFNGAYASMGRLNWDGHGAMKEQYDIHGEILDQPVAGLLKDLKQRGLLKDTLVVFATEFGRMPMFQMGTQGRDHNPHGFTGWLAGAGVKPGTSYGRTDEFGFKAVEDVATPHDFHATILHLLGLDHERLTYYHNGIERRLTNVHGHVIKDILT